MCLSCDGDMELQGEMPNLYSVNGVGGTVDTVAAFVQVGDTAQINGVSGEVTGTIRNPDGSITLAIGDSAGATVTPNTRVEIEDPFADIRSDQWDIDAEPIDGDESSLTWDGREIGFDSLRVHEVGVSGSPAGGTAYAYASLVEDPVSGGGLTQEQFDRGELYLRDAISERYGADITHIEGNVLSMDITAELRGETHVNEAMAGDVLYEKSKLTEWVNESDAGTYGSPYFYTDIRKNINAGFFPGAGGATTFDDRLRQDAREAASFAVHGRSRDRFPQLGMLADRGYCLDAQAAHDEIVEASKDLGEIRETRGLRELLDRELGEQARRRS
ncbi:hypothetical protein EDF62_1532 [Leucobacter luti]|uniref:Uncharacterized protein n=2 Tax=Leucobacter luti TaxID=340320 RepID=A0A4R6S123_9MICO|nr:hypothetical protein EDF62_1532 [Leucobacter luti]